NPLHFEPSRDGADLGSFQLAAKTGTSSGAAGPPDIITAGYSPYLTVAVWIGNADGSSMAPGIIGVAGAGYVFHDIMLWSLQHYNWPHDAQFPIPPLMAQGDFNCATGLAPYKGSTAADMTCREVPPAFALKCGCYNKLYDYSGLTGTMIRVNQDWYLQGEAPLLS
ncbi:MAG TPA: hypothetical protein VGS80_21365, partial [Ktedonobacterales bacterium]|nr:hypothetical protein [Ktedonobacterales bacterium]